MTVCPKGTMPNNCMPRGDMPFDWMPIYCPADKSIRRKVPDSKNSIEYDGEVVADHGKIANNMNEFYITMSKQLPDPINNSDYCLHKSTQ